MSGILQTLAPRYFFKIFQTTKTWFIKRNLQYLYVGVGTNIGNRSKNINSALREACKIFGNSNVERTSFLYETSPKYVENQPLFLNAVFQIKSNYEPVKILQILKDIEKKIGRVPSLRNGPRLIDLDILFYGDINISLASSKKDEPFLQIPHPRIEEREFVLRPLCDINPNLVHPTTGKTVHQMLKDVLSVKPAHEPEIQRVIPLPRERHLILGKHTLIMGILNCTPDSFSDGNKFLISDPDWVLKAVDCALKMIEEGADILDIGGESTRPGAVPVEEEVELSRVLPVIAGIRERNPDIAISVDTRSRFVAAMAHAAGADIINDVSSGLFDPTMMQFVSASGIPFIMMHSKGTPETMNGLAEYTNVVSEVAEFLVERIKAADYFGIPRWNQIIDPGIGFAKKFEHNVEIMKNLDTIINLAQGTPLLIGPSRKKFIGKLTNQAIASERDWGTAGAVCASIGRGASIIRVHNVKAMKEVAAVYEATNFGSLTKKAASGRL